MMTKQTTDTKAQPQDHKLAAAATVAPAAPTEAVSHEESGVSEPNRPVAAACCGVQKQQSCCAPSAKASCCGAQATTGSCGCQ
jgi:arsenite methyltransferase